MSNLSVFGPEDQFIENVTRDQMNTLLSEDQPDVRLFCLDTPDGSSYQLVIGDPKRAYATIKTFISKDVERTVFDNIPDAISAFREITARFFRA